MRPAFSFDDGKTKLFLAGRTGKPIPYGHSKVFRAFETLQKAQEDGGFSSVLLTRDTTTVVQATQTAYLFTVATKDGRSWEQRLVHDKANRSLRMAWLRDHLWSEAEIMAINKLRDDLLDTVLSLDMDEVSAGWT